MKESLADYVRRVRREKGYSAAEVAKRSHNEISDAYIARIENGYVKNVSPEKLEAIAKGLDVPKEDIINVAHGRSAQPTRFEIYAERFDAHDLSESEWQFLELHFKDQIERFRREKEAYRQWHIDNPPPEEEESPDVSVPHKVVARIDPGEREKVRRDIQRGIDEGIPDEPRKRRHG